MQYEPDCGEHISKCIVKMAEMYDKHGVPITAIFNDVSIVYDGSKTTEDVITDFDNECVRRHREFKASPEGQRFKEECRLAQEKNEKAVAEGILPFALKDKSEWDKIVEANNDPYGHGVILYASRWAHLMDKELADGKALINIADQTSHEADHIGITGFMYGCAISILSQVWEHGEELRKWHNLKTQIDHEGEKANESGGVLNPAVLCVK